MVVRVEVGDRSDEGILIDGFRLMRVAIGGLVGHVVDPVGLVRLAVGVHHGGVVPATRETFFLAMSLFVAISADDIGVSRGVVTGWPVVAGRAGVIPGLESTIAGAECSDLFDFLLG